MAYITSLKRMQYGLKARMEGRSGIIVQQRNIVLININLFVLKSTPNSHRCISGS